MGKRNRDRSNSKNRNRDRSNSRRRNSFGTSIPNAPPRAQKNIKKKKKRLPEYRSSTDTSRIDLSESENDNAENDMNILNTMDKRKERIFAKLEDRKNRLFGNRINNKT